MTGRRRRDLIVAAALAVVVAVALIVVAVTRGGEGIQNSAADFRPPAKTTVSPPSGMPIVALDRLPKEAQRVVEKIETGGSFQHRQDGAVFANRERRLPRRAAGYYREYTVPTPGATDRGARRIIAGAQGELYYTADHYASFQWIQRGASP